MYTFIYMYLYTWYVAAPSCSYMCTPLSMYVYHSSLCAICVHRSSIMPRSCIVSIVFYHMCLSLYLLLSYHLCLSCLSLVHYLCALLFYYRYVLLLNRVYRLRINVSHAPSIALVSSVSIVSIARLLSTCIALLSSVSITRQLSISIALL